MKFLWGAKQLLLAVSTGLALT